jgi:hypothetical protein
MTDCQHYWLVENIPVEFNYSLLAAKKLKPLALAHSCYDSG